MVDRSTIYSALCNMFPDGVDYADAIQICLGLYVVGELLPEVDNRLCTMEGIAEAFQTLAKEGKIVNYCKSKAVLYGSFYHDYRDKGHWVEIIASIFKLGTSVDHERLETLGFSL